MENLFSIKVPNIANVKCSTADQYAAISSARDAPVPTSCNFVAILFVCLLLLGTERRRNKKQTRGTRGKMIHKANKKGVQKKIALPLYYDITPPIATNNTTSIKLTFNNCNNKENNHE